MPFPPPPRVSPRRRSTPRFIDRKTGDEKRHELWESGGGRPPRRAGKRGFKRALSPPLSLSFPPPFHGNDRKRERNQFFSLSIFRHDFLSYSLDPFFRSLLVHSIFCGMIFGYFSFSALSILSYRQKFIHDTEFRLQNSSSSCSP